jgi:hypothetical protein
LFRLRRYNVAARSAWASSARCESIPFFVVVLRCRGARSATAFSSPWQSPNWPWSF